MNIEEKVYKKLLEVPAGKVTTYGELARAVGLSNGQRTIGRIMKKNPYPVDRKSTRLNSSHIQKSRMPSSA